MASGPRPTFAYLRFLEAEISQFLNTLQVGLNEVEVVQQEIQEVQTFLIQRKADLDIISNLLAVVQALLCSGNETSE
jgi:hypothetical protein